MRNKTGLRGTVLTLTFLLGGAWLAHAGTKVLDAYKTVVVDPFESSAKGAGGLPEAVRSSVIQALKDGGVFMETLTPEEAKAKQNQNQGQNEKGNTGVLKLQGRLVDFNPGNAAKRLMVGLGTGRAHATFEFTLKDASSGEVVWQKTVKQTASFWFNGTTSSAAERGELPEGVAKKLVQELNKAKAK